MALVRVLVLRAPGINCDEETAFAWQAAGARADRVHVNRLMQQRAMLGEYQVFTIPGGFSYGDDIASGRILGNLMAHHLGQDLAAFIDRGGLVLGICNGFQVLVRAGLLPGAGCDIPVTLTQNDSGRYEDRWIRLRAEVSHCPFLEEGSLYDLPAAHGEGKFVPAGGTEAIPRLESLRRIAARYVSRTAGPPAYPENPNGSIGNVAGLVDGTGRVLGLMPHPERSIHPSQAPDYLRDIHADTGGHRLFLNVMRYLA